MNPWEATGTWLGWIVFGIVALIAVLLALSFAIVIGVLLVSTVQTIVQAIRSGNRPKLAAVLPFTRKEKP